MGAEITVEHGYITPRSMTRLKGARITTDMVTVTGTENLLMAAALAEGETVLENAAQEPEVTDLAELLISMGAKIEGHGTSRIASRAWTSCTRRRVPHHIMPDRIEAGTFLCAVAAAGGDVRAAGHAAPITWMRWSTSCARPVPDQGRRRRMRIRMASRPKRWAFAPASTRRSPPTCRRS
jgi:UDP-N-acetylglucosamine enolpyruvyl transferase